VTFSTILTREREPGTRITQPLKAAIALEAMRMAD
jgi:hypothetical protein